MSGLRDPLAEPLSSDTSNAEPSTAASAASSRRNSLDDVDISDDDITNPDTRVAKSTSIGSESSYVPPSSVPSMGLPPLAAKTAMPALTPVVGQFSNALAPKPIAAPIPAPSSHRKSSGRKDQANGAVVQPKRCLTRKRRKRLIIGGVLLLVGVVIMIILLTVYKKW